MTTRSTASVSRLIRVAMLLLLCASTACTSPSEGDLAGTWTMKEESRRYLPAEVRTLTPRVTLNSDGTFTAVDVPQHQIGGSGVVVMAGGGKWRIDSDRVQLNFQEGFGFGLFWSSFPGSPIELHYSLTDPDLVEWIRFTKP